MNPIEQFQIPPEKQDEFMDFLKELGYVIKKLRNDDVPRILENWDRIKEAKRTNPNYWWINK